MDLKTFDKAHGKTFLVVAVVLIWSAILWSLFIIGYFETWYIWSFPAKLPPFMDFRMLPGAADTFRAGIDPALRNPFELWERPFNYPKVWYLLFYTGISQDDTIWICTILLILFFSIVLIFPEKLRVRDTLLFLGIIFSSACALLYERGNVDILIFILCGLVILLINRFPNWAVLVISVAAILKYYPIFGVAAFFDEKKSKFFRMFFPSSIIFLIYILFESKGFAAAWNLTERSTFLSYGVNVIFSTLYAYIRYYLLKIIPESQIQPAIKYSPYLIALILLGLLFLIVLKQREPLVAESQRNLTAFRLGAAIYIGTFLLGDNYDYRMAFLIFAVPQLSQWLFSAHSKNLWLFIGVFIALFASCWSSVLRYYFIQLFDSNYMLQLSVFDETMTWILFAGLAYLLFKSFPVWLYSIRLKELIKPLELIRSS